MGIVPDMWYEKYNEENNVNPFSALPSQNKDYVLSDDRTTTETKLLRKTLVEADTDFISLEVEKEFEFYELKA